MPPFQSSGKQALKCKPHILKILVRPIATRRLVPEAPGSAISSSMASEAEQLVEGARAVNNQPTPLSVDATNEFLRQHSLDEVFRCCGPPACLLAPTSCRHTHASCMHRPICSHICSAVSHPQQGGPPTIVEGSMHVCSLHNPPPPLLCAGSCLPRPLRRVTWRRCAQRCHACCTRPQVSCAMRVGWAASAPPHMVRHGSC